MTPLEKHKLAVNIGKTARLMDSGLSPVEIAAKLKVSESTAREWVGIVTEAREIKAKKESLEGKL